jgi:death-on-curing protein
VSEPVWLRLEAILAAHDDQLAEHGGGAGIRDQGLLESALARPLNLHAYGEPSLSKLAAAYAFGIAKNHPFIDGNKRTALVAAELFLGLNGHDLTATDAQCVEEFLALAAGEITEEELAVWISRQSAERKKK